MRPSPVLFGIGWTEGGTLLIRGGNYYDDQEDLAKDFAVDDCYAVTFYTGKVTHGAVKLEDMHYAGSIDNRVTEDAN